MLLRSMFIYMHSILGWASFCMNYCMNAAWHGGDQPVALLRCNEAQVALIAAFRSSALLGLVSLIFLLTIPHKACQQKEAWCAITFPDRWLRWLWTQWTNTSRWPGSPNHLGLWKLHSALQATWILCLSTLPPDSRTLIYKLNEKFTFIWKEEFGLGLNDIWQLIHRAVDRWQATQSHVHYRMRFFCDSERELRSLSAI